MLFLLPALSLAGIPPFSGFVAKLALVEAGVDDRQYVIVAVSLAVSLLTLFSMTKIWANAFWGPRPQPSETPAHPRAGRTVLMTGSTASLVVLSLVITVTAGPIYRLAERAAADLVDPAAYVQAVLGR